MGNEGIEYFFLNYANFFPDESVQKFIKDFIYKIGLSFRLPNEMRQHLESLQVVLSNFEDYQDKNKARKHLEELEEKREQFQSKLTLPIVKDLFCLVYGPDEGPCFGICPYGGTVRNLIISDFFVEPQDLGCFKCNLLCFKRFLDKIINGKEYSQIFGLTQFLMEGRNLVFNSLVIEPTLSDSCFKEELKPTLFWNTTIPILSLSLYIDMVLSYSLGEFLINNDRRKLIICQHCGKYAIARKLNQKYCSQCSRKGKKSKEQRREAQRRWREKKRKQNETQKYENRIENLMIRAGISREEAKKYIDADLELERNL